MRCARTWTQTAGAWATQDDGVPSSGYFHGRLTDHPAVQHEVRASWRTRQPLDVIRRTGGRLNRLRAQQWQADPTRPRQNGDHDAACQHHRHQGDKHRRQRQANRAFPCSPMIESLLIRVDPIDGRHNFWDFVR
jgi:hypothetical protein